MPDSGFIEKSEEKKMKITSTMFGKQNLGWVINLFYCCAAYKAMYSHGVHWFTFLKATLKVLLEEKPASFDNDSMVNLFKYPALIF